MRHRIGAVSGAILLAVVTGSVLAENTKAQEAEQSPFDSRFFFDQKSEPPGAGTTGRAESPGLGSVMDTVKGLLGKPAEAAPAPVEAAPAPAPPQAGSLADQDQAEQPTLPPRIAAPAPRPEKLASRSERKARPLAVGRAAYYEHPGRTASGEKYDPDGMTAAHRSLPLGTRLRVVNLRNKKSVVVRVNDRAPATIKFAIDLSRGSAEAIGIGKQNGVASVAIYKLD